ncbi:MAG: polyphosphate:AMP phosphotransferase [Defluviicoccus sp.]|nr:MAG: polyphosphate:AMP phosphotransferase [Defluviicoccus sp.]
MFRTAELGRTVSKDAFHEAVPVLRAALLEVQQQLRSAPFPVILVFGGVDKGGKSETVNLLNEWLDPRWLMTRAYGPPSDEMVERPEYWRYWRDLPPKGRVGLFLSCWYSRPLIDRVYGRSSEADFDEALDRIIAFEQCLADDHALILKFWMHLGKKAQKERLTKLEKNPLTRWRVTQTDWDHWHMFEQFVGAAERLIMRTSTGKAPWHIVEGYDKRYRGLTVAQTVLDGIRRHCEEIELHRQVAAERKARQATPVAPVNDPAAADNTSGASAVDVCKVLHLPRISVLSRLEQDAVYDKKAYQQQLEEQQGQLNTLCRQAKNLGMSTILVFEGWDAAGKGGAIRRVTAALDARDYQVIPIAAPTDEERAQHYLWRFWRHLSRAGRVTIFDRSWYGRVLVERVEGFASAAEWKRAYAEITDFEDQLVRHGIVLCKYWLHISKDEQMARFKAREGIEYKRWKLTEEDWRNREKWDEYEHAVDDMVEHTSTTLAPWTLVAANDKRFARLKVLTTACERLAAGIERAEAAGAQALRAEKLGRTG